MMYLFRRAILGFEFKLSLIDRYLPYSPTDLQPISIVNEYKFSWWFRRLGIAHIDRLQHGKPSDAASGGSRKRLRSVLWHAGCLSPGYGQLMLGPSTSLVALHLRDC